MNVKNFKLKIFDFRFVIIRSVSVCSKEKKNRTLEYSKYYQKIKEGGTYKIEINVVYISVY